MSEKTIDMIQTNRIIIKNLNKVYGSGHEKTIFFNQFNISFEVDKINCIIGKSGCGKSTLLRFISGIEKVDSGSISFQKYEDRKILFYMIFQNQNLFPWLTVYQNLELRLANKKLRQRKKKDVIYSALEKYDLLDTVNKYSYQMSGGMIQKIAFICSLIFEPDVILMDEPLSSLDQISKREALQFLRQEKIKNRMTVIYVTHDIHEALSIADNIYILKYDKMNNHSFISFQNNFLNQSDPNDYMSLIKKIEDYLE